jgi:hypothetical protein
MDDFENKDEHKSLPKATLSMKGYDFGLTLNKCPFLMSASVVVYINS